MCKGFLSRLAIAAVFSATSLTAASALTWTGTATADTFVATGTDGSLSSSNFGGAGTLAIAPASSTMGEFQSLLRFDLSGTSGAAAAFNAQYGVGNWQITSITLTLASNAATQGGSPGNAIFNSINAGDFGISWVADDSWVEGTGSPSGYNVAGMNYNSLGTLLSSGTAALGTYTYTPPGTNVPVTWNLGLDSSLVSDATASQLVSFLFYATPGSDVSYLFNSRSYGTVANRPVITITAVPEPGTWPLALGGLAVLGLGWRRFRRE